MSNESIRNALVNEIEENLNQASTNTVSNSKVSQLGQVYSLIVELKFTSYFK